MKILLYYNVIHKSMDKKQSIHVAPFRMTPEWATQAKLLQEKFPILTEADLKLSAGKENEMLKRVEAKLGKSRFEVQSIIRNLQSTKI